MALTSQRFCLRWNNHQSNLLSVFDQLLHDEAFVDVTLAVEGQFLRAHKMILSACSPYFQALFVGHPDKHPIVILKDVPYADMRSLLDFMYRGEVSVDQDRLTAFLKVAESLRIKGLTEVNEERCDLPSIASSLLSSAPPPPPPPPHLHRIHLTQPKRPLPPMAANPLLGSALTAPKRKRGRPRKLSGSSGGTPGTPGASPEEETGDTDMKLHHPNRTDSPAMGPPDLLEVNMGEQDMEPTVKEGDSPRSSSGTPALPEDRVVDGRSDQVKKESNQEPTPGTSQDGQGFKSSNMQQSSEGDPRFATDLPILRLVPKSELMAKNSEEGEDGNDGGGGGGGCGNSGDGDNDNNNESHLELKFSPGLAGGCYPEPAGRPPPVRRRVRRRATSSSDPAEQLTEMSVRGLNLFRYASVSEGLWKCMECAKADILKTFKNKYSFQRHAFLYHEGHQRKVFPCPVCAKEFSRPDKMKNHMKMVHECFMPKDVFPSVGFYVPPQAEYPPVE